MTRFQLTASAMLLTACVATGVAQAKTQEKPTVGLDHFYNHELRGEKQWHYTWDDKAPSGYSELGGVVEKLGGRPVAVRQAASADALEGVDVYIIVDPDTNKETKHPNYICPKAAKAIADWVRGGGVLVLMNNNAGNAEFEHMNRLAGQFGIQFNEDSRNNGGIPSKTMDALPDHPFFEGCDKLHMVGICTLSVEPPAEAAYTHQGDVIMATAKLGDGTVFALGDPWIYNEYMDHQDNRQSITNIFRWLLDRAK
jgi:unsaturated rhamnogalacturonyl hydrolase